MSSDSVIAEVIIAATPATIWRALREPEQIRRWHGWEYDGLDKEIKTIYQDGATASEEELMLETGAGRFALEPRNGGTHVRITRPAPPGKASWDGVSDEVNDGWVVFIHQLRYYLERHPGQDRRTILHDQPVPPTEGEVWFHTDRHSGVVLDEHTLVTTIHGRYLANCYGLDDAAFASLRERFNSG